MMEFSIHPYEGASPITFEMTAAAVEALLGPPDVVRLNELGERDELRGKISVRYSSVDNKVVEIAFVPGVAVSLHGCSLFEAQDLVDFLLNLDPYPLEFVGFLIFLRLGITVTGFHDQDEAQKAITVFREGRWDEFRREAQVFKKRKE